MTGELCGRRQAGREVTVKAGQRVSEPLVNNSQTMAKGEQWATRAIADGKQKQGHHRGRGLSHCARARAKMKQQDFGHADAVILMQMADHIGHSSGARYCPPNTPAPCPAHTPAASGPVQPSGPHLII